MGSVEFLQMGVLVAGGYSYTGAKAHINVWNPYVAATDEYTSGLVSLRNGVYNNSDEIEFGWTVSPSSSIPTFLLPFPVPHNLTVSNFTGKS